MVQCFGQRLIELSRLRGAVASAFWLPASTKRKAARMTLRAA